MTFKSGHGLQSHYRQSPSHHVCITCRCDFDDEDELWEHAEEDHNACPECHELFDSYEELQEHDSDEHDYCTDCQKSFGTPSHLSSKYAQPENLHFLAHNCSLTFASHDVKSMAQHMTAKHPYCRAHNRVIG